MQLSNEIKFFAVTLQVIALILGLCLYVQGLGSSGAASSVATLARG